jgi:hypothetical protein
MPEPKKIRSGVHPVARRVAEQAAALYEPQARVRRKNYELDQNRIDLVKAVLGVASETEALTRAMDLVLDMAEFAHEVDQGTRRLIGRGGFVNQFDDEAALDWSGFDRPRATRSRRK